MAAVQDIPGNSVSTTRSSTWEILLLFSFCVLVAVVALAVSVYLAVSGLLFTLDGLVLLLIALTIGGLFGLNVVWSVRRGEMRQLLDHARKNPASNESSAISSGDGPR